MSCSTDRRDWWWRADAGYGSNRPGAGGCSPPTSSSASRPDLGYAVTRTETFWPYSFGREPLLKDRVAAGEGVLIVGEAPLSARNGQVRRGVEGMIDAGMKVFGM